MIAYIYIYIYTYCGIYKSSYNLSNISYLNSPPPSFSFILPSPHSGSSLNRYHFPFTYMCTQYLHYIHSPAPFLHILPSSTGTNPCRGPVPDSYDFCKRKMKYFCLFMVAIQGVSLWNFYVYMYCNPNWVISSIFLLSTLVPLLGGFNRFKKSIFILV
jgi:hypothetical protein